jgi:multidrug efflux system membrane fusion protein
VRSADSTALVTINQLQPILVAFSVPQESMGELQRALVHGKVPVTAKIPDSTVPVQQGDVSYVENAIDPATNTLSVKAQFPNTDEFLWPSQFVNVVMTLRVDPDATVIPTVAVQMNQEGAYVWVVKADSTVEMRPITVTRQLGQAMVVEGALKAGEKIVTEGQLRLESGTKVEVAADVPDDPQSKTLPEAAVKVTQ